MEVILYIALDAILGGIALWIAAKITSVDISILQTVIAAGASALASMVPGFGWVLSVLILFFLLKQFSQANIWPDVLLMVIVGRLVSFVAVAALGGI